jgi:hypothetical protein
MGYVIIMRIGGNGTVRTKLPEDVRLDEAKERGLRELKKLLTDGISVHGATIESNDGSIVSSILAIDQITLEYLDVLEGNYLAAWT